ncbi:Threonine/homoserine/homoserine lactone efflux protein [Chitinophaga sp. YR573]|uniref:LysE family transporter n=1 Tax=Chitinophaga sp. YR573 TaxID=1881040 RepID=UPI0008D6512F|nr:LysE family transporter [Chitinophaga sp. YR573]SEW36093.1 Threonine/homoserine/homoserine lactone efflux protein [Chitinophaga sp. YR573]
MKKLFSAAFLISFIGTLPIGTLNTNVANYALNNNVTGAIQFGVAAIFIEVIVVRIALFLIDRLIRLRQLFKILSLMICVAILFLAFKSLEAAFQMRTIADVLPLAGKQPFYTGLLLSLLNPLHLPFWMGWTAVLKSRQVLNDNGYSIYILAVGTGTAAAFILYGLIGSFLMDVLKTQQYLINWVLGFTLLFTGLMQGYRLIMKKAIQY